MTLVKTRKVIDTSMLEQLLHPKPEFNKALVLVAPKPPAEVAVPASPPVPLSEVLRALAIAPLGVTEMPKDKKRITVDGQPWKFTSLKAGTTHYVPPSVAQRAMQAQALGIPFQYWLAEEQPVPVRQAAPRRRLYDPILLGILPLGDGRGLFCSLGAWDHPQPTRGAR